MDDDGLDEPIDISVRKARKARQARRGGSSTPPPQVHLDVLIARRRKLVMQARLAGHKTAPAVRAWLKERDVEASLSTVKNDLMVLDVHFRETAQSDRTMERGLDLERIESLVGVFLPAALKGDKGAAKICVDAISLRVRVLGTESARKVEISVMDQVQQVAAQTGLPVERVHAMCQDLLLQAGVNARLD